MSPAERFNVQLPTRTRVDVYLIQLPDGRVVSRTAAELETAPEEERLAAGLPPASASGTR